MLSAGAGATPNTLTTVSRDFKVANNWQNNVQIERQLSDRFAASVGASYARGYNLPLISNINAINPIGRLTDGRPIYSTAVNSSTRLDPRYNVINQIESLGESTYKNLTAQLTGRNLFGLQFDFAYTLGKAEDNAPITGVLSVQGDAGRTNPESLDFDKGPNVLDQRHTFVGQHRGAADHRRRQRHHPRPRERHHPRRGDAVRQRRADQPARQPGRDQQRRHRQRPARRASPATRCACRRATTSTCVCRVRSPSAARAAPSSSPK